jgi:hypothetical protein
MNAIKTTSERLDDATEALLKLKSLSDIHNDFDHYCYELVLWGLGQLSEKPNPADFGLKGVEP